VKLPEPRNRDAQFYLRADCACAPGLFVRLDMAVRKEQGALGSLRRASFLRAISFHLLFNFHDLRYAASSSPAPWIFMRSRKRRISPSRNLFSWPILMYGKPRPYMPFLNLKPTGRTSSRSSARTGGKNLWSQPWLAVFRPLIACAFLRKPIIRKLAQSKTKKLRQNPLFFSASTNAST
jgi:hypothetical protein